VIRRVLLAPVALRTWREVGYCATGAVLAVPAFALALLGVVGCVLSPLTVGLPPLAGALLLARLTVRYFRVPATWFLGWTWPDPPPLPGQTRLFARADAVLRDSTGWRALAYCFIRLPFLAVGTYLGLILLAEGVVGVTNAVWEAEFDVKFSLPGGPWVLVAAGVVLLLVFPWYFRFIVWIDGRLVRVLLQPSPDRARIAALESSRAVLRADAAALLRRVERDLHDGTQARLVALGVALSRIRQRVTDPPAQAMISDARHAVVEALAELREIVRGMHPPALDAGLPTALETLAARSAVPVEVRVEVRDGTSPATESALYFGAAELLTNVARHAGATLARLDLCEDGDALRLAVSDNGQGGARADGTGGTGLAGLHRRAAALDGSLVVHSPPGGPTRIEMRLPKDGRPERNGAR
jgi:signal transduction histidine kinase